MRENDIKLIKARSRFHFFITIITVVAIIGIPMNICFLISSIKNGVSELVPFFSFVLAVIILLEVFAKAYAGKHDFEKSPVEPYEITMKPTDFETFKRKLGIFPDEPIYKDFYCTLVQREKEIVLISEYIGNPENARIEKHYLKSERDHAVEIAVKKGVLPKTVTQYRLQKTGILILYVFDEVNSDVLNLLRENIDRESTLTAAADLKNGKIFIRALWGGVWHDDLVYRYMMKMISNSLLQQ